MKKLASVLALASLLSLGTLSACNKTSEPTDTTPVETTPTVTVKQDENKYVDYTTDDFMETPFEDYQALEDEGKVVYFFEGQYIEGFGTSLDPCYLDLYLCDDGLLYGSNTGLTTSCSQGEQLFGYWYNVNSSGENEFMIHFTGYNITAWGTVLMDYPADIQNIICNPLEDYAPYTYTASVTFPFYGNAMTRLITIYGMPYMKVKSLTADTTNMKKFYQGNPLSQFAMDDNFGLKFTCDYGVEGYTTVDIHNERVRYSGYDPSKTGKQTVTAKFLGASCNFEVETLPPEGSTFPEGEIEYTAIPLEFANAGDHPNQYTITTAEDKKSCDISYDKPEGWSNVQTNIPDAYKDEKYTIFSITIENKGTAKLDARIDLNNTKKNAWRQDGESKTCINNQIVFSVDAGKTSVLEFSYTGKLETLYIFVDSMGTPTGTNSLHFSDYKLGFVKAA